jgi:TP901 family phage tail tape measure protein
MSSSIQYVLSLNDKISSKLQKIGISSDNALNKFAKLEKQTNDTRKLMNDMGGSVGALRQKLDLLRSEKEWIPQSNINSIRAYNTEIKKLEKEIQHLDTINGSVFKRNLKDAVSNLPFSNLITNPVALAGAGLFAAGKSAMNFEEGMAKINTTAQLSKSGLEKLGDNIRKVGVEYGADLTTVPETYEKILSQTGDVALSNDILKQALKGSKAGFTDQTLVADALAQSLSIVGKENTNAQEVLDTFFAAKRVGAGEFKDFAQYMPGLIASGKSLGINFKEVAGTFAYMTGKGQSAERSAVLMENAFAALNKTDVRKNLKNAGVNVFDSKGSIRSMQSIFGDLQTRMAGMTDEMKSSFLAQMGLVDKEARSAFLIMTTDSKKLDESMKAVKNSAGETDKAFQNSQNSAQKLRNMWSHIQNITISLGGVVASVLSPAFDLLSITLIPILDGISWLIDLMKEHYLIAGAFAAIIGIIVIALNAAKIAQWANNMALKAGNFWLDVLIAKERIFAIGKTALSVVTGLLSGATWSQVAAQNGLNAAMLANPIGLIIIAIVALIALIVACIKKYEEWGAAILLMMGPIGLVINAIMALKRNWESVKQAFTAGGILGGLKRIGIVLLDAVLYPVQQLLKLLSKIPGMAHLAGKGVDKIADIRKKLNLVDDPAKVSSKGVNGAMGKALKGKSKVDKSVKSKVDFTPVLPIADPTKDKDKTKATNEAIATGGVKQTTINLNFKNVVESLVVRATDLQNSADQIEQQVGDALLRTLGMAATTAG